MARTVRLLPPERERIILDRLSTGPCGINELTSLIGASEATIRRDLKSLDKAGKLQRIHGGAVQVGMASVEPPFEDKEAAHVAEKRAIAEAAAETIQEGETIYLDSGSTVLHLARRLGGKRRLTVATNCLGVADILANVADIRLIVVGGEYRRLSRAMVGPLTSGILDLLRFDRAFLGTLGLTVDDGITTTDPAEAYTKSIVMGRSKQVYVLADSSKFGVSYFVRSGTLAGVHCVFTDTAAPPAMVEELRQRGVRVCLAEPAPA